MNAKNPHDEPYMAVWIAVPIYDNQEALSRRQLDSAFEWENLIDDEQEIAGIVSWLEDEKSRYTSDAQNIMDEKQNLFSDQKTVIDIFIDQVSCLHQGIIP